MTGLFFAGLVGLCVAFWVLLLPPGISVIWVVAGAIISWLLLVLVGASERN